MESSFDDSFDEWSTFMGALQGQSHLGQALIVATYLDEQLARILQWFMVEGRYKKDMASGPGSPLGTFSAKIQMAYALGLIDEQEAASIQAIRKIRNEFAHNIAISFTDEKVRGKLEPLLWAVGEEKLGNLDGYELFFIGSQRLVMQLLNRADHVRAERRKAKKWPPERIDYDYDPDYDPKDYIY